MRPIRIRNTLTGELERLEPRDPGKVAIYACGPTVYSRIHIGNARPYVLFMLFKRFLEREGYDVSFVANITDINDKIYVAARERGVPSDALAREMTQAYIDDTDGLRLGRPDHEPLASETLGPIIDLIEALIKRGCAYESGGDVYFSVAAYDRYGELSNRDPAAMEQGEDDNSLKRDAADFALWKARKSDEDTGWPSPWGEGRPGWHIECSAMAENLLGLEFDVHGGGVDLVFPHHENEAAQTSAGRGRPLARIWMHNGMVRFTGEKMSKSLGNVWGLAEALDTYGSEALIMFFLSGHYRAPIECSPVTLDQARANVERLRELGRKLAPGGSAPPEIPQTLERFYDALADDFNTPAAMAALFDAVREANRRIAASEEVGSGPFAQALAVVGLESTLAATGSDRPDATADGLLAMRDAARAAGDYAESDRIRDELLDRGWVVRDGADGSTLVPKP